MSNEKIQPWKAHWVPQAGNPAIVSYQERAGAEIIADGGSAGPPVQEGVATASASSVSESNRLCPHLGKITNPTLK